MPKKEVKKKWSKRSGDFPEFETWNLLCIAVTSFNIRQIDLVKERIDFKAFSYSDLKNGRKRCWALPDLGSEMNKLWDDFCDDPDNKVRFERYK